MKTRITVNTEAVDATAFGDISRTYIVGKKTTECVFEEMTAAEYELVLPILIDEFRGRFDESPFVTFDPKIERYTLIFKVNEGFRWKVK